MKKLFFAFIMLGLAAYLSSENLPVKGKRTGDEIFLRWAVTDVGLWRKAQQQGFLVERFSVETILWNGKVRNDFVRDKFWIVKPHSIDDTAAWFISENDDAVMLTAQTLLQGVDMGDDTLSYITAMIACDRSFTAACMAGFGLKDTLPLEKQKYLYKVSSRSTGIFGEWEVTESKTIHAAEPLQTAISNKSVTLSFSTAELNKNFSAYYFERATKRGNFERLHTVPFTVFGSDTAQTIFYYDTVREYDIIYRYRVTGQDIFGAAAVVSQQAQIKCTPPVPSVIDTFTHIEIRKDTLPPYPAYITACTQDSNGIVLLTWKKSMSKDVEGYRIFRAYGSFKNTDDSPETHLRFGQITPQPVSDTFFRDTISKKNHRKTFYCIKATDSVGNESKRSNILFAQNPLPNFPSPAFVTSCEQADKNKVLFKWTNSFDSDTRGHKIFMRKDSGQWTFATDIPLVRSAQNQSDSVFITLKENGLYYFDVRAYTENAEISAPFFARYVLQPAAFKPSFDAVPMRDKFCIVLQWKQSEITDVKKIYIYRRTVVSSRSESNSTVSSRTETNNFTLIKTLSETDISQGEYRDKNIKIGNTCQYKIQYEFEDGTLSEYSKNISVEY